MFTVMITINFSTNFLVKFPRASTYSPSVMSRITANDQRQSLIRRNDLS